MEVCSFHLCKQSAKLAFLGGNAPFVQGHRRNYSVVQRTVVHGVELFPVQFQRSFGLYFHEVGDMASAYITRHHLFVLHQQSHDVFQRRFHPSVEVALHVGNHGLRVNRIVVFSHQHHTLTLRDAFEMRLRRFRCLVLGHALKNLAVAHAHNRYYYFLVHCSMLYIRWMQR